MFYFRDYRNVGIGIKLNKLLEKRKIYDFQSRKKYIDFSFRHFLISSRYEDISVFFFYYSRYLKLQLHAICLSVIVKNDMVPLFYTLNKASIFGLPYRLLSLLFDWFQSYVQYYYCYYHLFLNDMHVHIIQKWCSFTDRWIELIVLLQWKENREKNFSSTMKYVYTVSIQFWTFIILFLYIWIRCASPPSLSLSIPGSFSPFVTNSYIFFLTHAYLHDNDLILQIHRKWYKKKNEVKYTIFYKMNGFHFAMLCFSFFSFFCSLFFLALLFLVCVLLLFTLLFW